jgi:hypothetical protein
MLVIRLVRRRLLLENQAIKYVRRALRLGYFTKSYFPHRTKFQEVSILTFRDE